MDISDKEIREAEARYCSQGDTAAKRKDKIFFERGDGCFAYTTDGRRLIDMQMFNSSANFGYRSKAHEAAIIRQMQCLPGIGSEFQTYQRVELSKKISESIVRRFGVEGRVHFSVSGAQAVDDALKIVATATGRRFVFAFEGGYHGRTLAAAAVSASYRYRHRFGSEGRAQFIPFPNCTRCAYGKSFPSCEYYCLGQFRRLLASEAAGFRDPDSGTVEATAFLVEPVQGRGGYVPPPPEYFEHLKVILDEFGVLLIVDDIQMGFFRTGFLWSMERYGVSPDLILFGKAITNGMFPVSGVWARNPLMDPASWTPSSAHATFAGHPIGMATALATFDLITRIDYQALAEAAGVRIEAGLRRLATSRPAIRCVQRLGLALSVEISQPETGEPWPELATKIKETALLADISPMSQNANCGLLLTIGGYDTNLITLSPALTISATEIDAFIDLFARYFDRAFHDLAWLPPAQRPDRVTPA